MRSESRETTPVPFGSARSMICLSSGVWRLPRTRAGIEYWMEPFFMFCFMLSIEFCIDWRSIECRTALNCCVCIRVRRIASKWPSRRCRSLSWPSRFESFDCRSLIVRSTRPREAASATCGEGSREGALVGAAGPPVVVAGGARWRHLGLVDALAALAVQLVKLAHHRRLLGRLLVQDARPALRLARLHLLLRPLDEVALLPRPALRWGQKALERQAGHLPAQVRGSRPARRTAL